MTDVMIAADMSDAELEAMIALEAEQAERARLTAIDVTPLRRMIDDFRDGTNVSRQQAEVCRDYFDGKQLDGPKKTALRRARQPQVIRNEIKPAINGVLGILTQAKVDPRAFPRNPTNEDAADVASKTLRYIGDQNRLHKKKIDCAENYLIEGATGAIVESDGENILINRIRFEELIYDPRAREADFSDASYMGIGKWMAEGDIIKMFPMFSEDIPLVYASNWGDMGLTTMQDRPDNLSECWIDKKKRRIFVVELYHREEDGWLRSVFYAGGVLDQTPSPYLDDYGQPCNPIVASSCNVTRENDRYGLVASMLSQQDELNAYASRLLHLTNSRQLQVTDPNYPPDVDADTARKEAARADGLLPIGYSIVPTTDMTSGAAAMMADARQALVRQAPTPAVLADASASSQSGRSRLVLQQAGMTEIARYLGRLEDFETAIYHQCWMRARQFWNEPKFIRITGAEGKPDFVQLNQPEVDPETGAPVVDPSSGQQQITNKLADWDIDIEVQTVPDTANLQAEQFEAMAPMFPGLQQAFGPEVAFNVALALSSMPDKQEVKDIIKESQGGDDPQAQAMAQMQQQIQQMQVEMGMRKAQADIAKTESEAALNAAKIGDLESDVVVKAADMQARAMGLPSQ